MFGQGPIRNGRKKRDAGGQRPEPSRDHEGAEIRKGAATSGERHSTTSRTGLLRNSPAQRSLARGSRLGFLPVWKASPALCGLFASAAAFAGLTLLFSACGYIGEPLPPALDIPTRVTDLRVVEYGENLTAQFTLPALTTQGLALKSVQSVDLYVGVIPTPFTQTAWAASARRVPISVKGPGALTHSVPAREWIGKDLFLGVRATGPKGKVSDWSNLAQLHVEAPLPLPTSFEAKNVAKGVQLTWKSSGTGQHYRIFRATGVQTPERIAETNNPAWLDETTHYLTPYRYYVQAISGELLQSELTDPQTITPADVFPPAVPAGLTAVPATSSIELAWERNTEADFAGYNVYRSLDGPPVQKLAALLDAPAYSDRQVESGKSYRYAVSSVDRIGNESEKSPVVEVAAQ